VDKGFKIHVFGASGSGATTLAKAICANHGYHFTDIDDIFWEKTDPPFTKKRPKEQAFKQLQDQLTNHDNVVVSGAFVGWADSLKPLFDLFVFMHLPLETRLERIKKREFHRFKERVLPGGDLYQQHLDFLDWVSRYETGDINMRSKVQHETWLKDVSAPIIRVTKPLAMSEMLDLLKPYLPQESESK
jgi:adenylate kinase family enzyme